jgi:hypothetical protein
VKVTEHPSEGVGVSNESCDVLHDDVPGSYQAYDVSHPRPSPALVRDPDAAAGLGERLAGEPATDEIDEGAGF